MSFLFSRTSAQSPRHSHVVSVQVYKFATREVPRVLEEALINAGLEAKDVDHLLLHQANIRIMEVVAERLGIPMDKVSLRCACFLLLLNLHV